MDTTAETFLPKWALRKFFYIQRVAHITFKLTRALENCILTEYIHYNSIESDSMKDSLQFVVSLYLRLTIWKE